MPIYIQRNGQEHGPYREEEARSYLQAGQLLANDLARTDAERGWRPLRDVLAGPVAAVQPQAQPNIYAAAAQANSPAMMSSQPVTVVDVRMPFGSMVVFMIKWVLASIPAFLILAVLGAVITGVFAGMFASLGGMG
jgi:hypothetical protein